MKKFSKEFMEFINKGNIFELATAVVIGNALKSLIDSVVQYLIMPLIAMVTPQKSFETWTVLNFKVGMILSAGLNFVIIGFVVFVIIKLMSLLKKDEVVEEKVIETEHQILSEIRDLLKDSKN